MLDAVFLIWGFNLLPLSVIPNFRITNKGLVDVNSMKIEPLFE